MSAENPDSPFDVEPELADPTVPSYPRGFTPMDNPIPPAVVTLPAQPAPFRVPGALKALAAILIPLMGLVALLPGIPVVLAGGLGIGAFIASVLLGLAAPMPKFMEHRPLVPLALVPLLAGLSGALVQFAGVLPHDGHLYIAVYAAAVLCAFLAGKAAPSLSTPSTKGLALMLLVSGALLAAPALASDVADGLGLLTSTGTSVSRTVGGGALVMLQCDAAVYVEVGTGTVTADSTEGVFVDAQEKYDIKLRFDQDVLAVVSQSGTANCRVFRVYP